MHPQRFMVSHSLVAAALLLVACKEEPTSPKRLVNPDPVVVDDPDAPCSALVVESTPESGASNVYWRDEIRIVFDDYAADADIVVTDDAGADVPVDFSWDEARFNVRVLPAAPLAAATTYTVSVGGCGEDYAFEFTTDDWGAPLSIDSSELVGRVYNLDLAGADYEKPEGLGTLLGLYLTEPLLFQVTGVSPSGISLMGAQGIVNETTGEIQQNRSFRTWDFGTASFDENPYFGATTAGIAIDYAGSVIPMHNFHVEGTFSADGTVLGGARATGYGDTRDMGPLLQLGGDPGAVCDFAAGLGLECVECPDGNPWCLEIVCKFDDAEWLEGLELREIR